MTSGVCSSIAARTSSHQIVSPATYIVPSPSAASTKPGDGPSSPCTPSVRTTRTPSQSAASSTARTSANPCPRSVSASAGAQNSGTSLGESSMPASSRWSRCRWVTTMPASRWTITSAGSGSSTSGLGT